MSDQHYRSNRSTFQPLPPLVRMECLPVVNSTNAPMSSPSNDPNHDDDESNEWMMSLSPLSPTNRSITLLIPPCSSGVSTSVSDGNKIIYSHQDDANDDLFLWNSDDNMNMKIEEEEREKGAVKRISIDVSNSRDSEIVNFKSTGSGGMLIDDEDIVRVNQNSNNDYIMMDHVNDSIEDDPLLATLSGTCNDDYDDACRLSDTMIVPDESTTMLQPLPNLLSHHILIQEPNTHRRHDCYDDGNIYYHDNNKSQNYKFCEDDLDPCTADQLIAEAAGDPDTNNYSDSDLMIFEIDQSFFKMKGQTVGTESTVSSYSSIAPDLHSLNLDTSAGPPPPTFFTSAQFQERCKLLAESMRASQLSRQCLSLQENIKLRANLAKVLKDIERSTAKVQRHCLSQQIQNEVEQDELSTIDKAKSNNEPDMKKNNSVEVSCDASQGLIITSDEVE